MFGKCRGGRTQHVLLAQVAEYACLVVVETALKQPEGVGNSRDSWKEHLGTAQVQPGPWRKL